jgi:hypothetical protein
VNGPSAQAREPAKLREKWKITRARGYQLIDAADGVQGLSKILDMPNEAQARELARVAADLSPIGHTMNEAQARELAKVADYGEGWIQGPMLPAVLPDRNRTRCCQISVLANPS